jgi:hypothetical protein
LGYVLLEAPREYVLHGPLLSINWLRLYPHLGPASEATPSGGGCYSLMTAAHISPNVFSLWNFLSNIHRLCLTIHATSFLSFIHHIYTHIYIFYLHVSFIISLLRIFMAGRLPSVPCVRYNYRFLELSLWAHRKGYFFLKLSLWEHD